LTCRHHCFQVIQPLVSVTVRRKIWEKKINGNVRRDNKNYQALIADGWDYFIVWECELKQKSIPWLFNGLAGFLKSS